MALDAFHVLRLHVHRSRHVRLHLARHGPALTLLHGHHHRRFGLGHLLRVLGLHRRGKAVQVVRRAGVYTLHAPLRESTRHRARRPLCEQRGKPRGGPRLEHPNAIQACFRFGILHRLFTQRLQLPRRLVQRLRGHRVRLELLLSHRPLQLGRLRVNTILLRPQTPPMQSG